MTDHGLPLQTLDSLNESGVLEYGVYSQLHDQVSLLVDAIDDAPHGPECPLNHEHYRGRTDRFGTFPACNCWKAEVSSEFVNTYGPEGS